MKTTFLFRAALIALLISGLNSCSKSNEEPSTANSQPPTPSGNSAPSFQLEYMVSPLNSNISRIAYNDANGNTIATYDQSGFSNGTKMIMVSANNYTARISVLVNNMSGDDTEYHLVIMINGQVKQSVKVVVPAMTFNNFASADYTVQFK
jgi:hypothetical protein